VTLLRLPVSLKASPWPPPPDIQDIRLPPPFGWNQSLIPLARAATIVTPALATETNKLGTALLLADQVYRNCKNQPTRTGMPDADWLQFITEYVNCVYDRSQGHQCQGRVYLFMMACRAFNIDCRAVGAWGVITGLTNLSLTHSMVDVKIGGQWIGFDVHFGHSFRNEAGDRISCLQAQAILANDGVVVLDRGGFPEIPGLTLEYYMANVYLKPLKDILRYMVVGISAGIPVATAHAMDGSAWDGNLLYAGNPVPYDAKAFMQNPIYQALSA
jgi:hypothetical protein